jgi:hypothetical protein
LLCVNRIRNTYQIKPVAKTGPGRECCFCETRRMLNDVSLYKIEQNELVTNGTFVVTKQYVSVLRSLVIVTRVEDAILKFSEEMHTKFEKGDLITNRDCQLFLTEKKRRLCHTFNVCYMIVWTLAGSNTFIIN